MADYLFKENLLTEIQIPEKAMLSHTVHNDDLVKITLFAFAAGHEMAAHTAPVPAVIQILKGEATLALGTDVHQVAAGCLVHMPPQLKHGIVAKTPMLMLLTMLKTG